MGEKFAGVCGTGDAGHAPVMIAQCDREHRFKFVNRAYAEALGRQPPDLVGKSLLDVLAPETYANIKPHAEAALRGQCVEYEVDGSRLGQRVDYVHCACEPEFDASGTVIGYVIVALDVSARKRAERALQESELRLKEVEQRKDTFLAALAHELRNPLAPIRNGLELLRRAGQSRAMTEQAQSMMERQLVHLVRLIDDLLDVTRLARGTLELMWGNVDLGEIVRNAVDDCALLIEASGNELTVNLAPGPTPIAADATRLSRVVTTLLNNAASHAPPGGHIRVTTEKDENEVRLRVTDNGIGIQADRLPYLFQMPTQTEGFLDRSHGGLGLGLALVKGVVDMHGGSIQAQSDGAGMGSEFVVRLPLGPHKKVDHALPAQSDRLPVIPLSRRILVADDNEDAVVSLALLLKGTGHQVRMARNGLEAVEVAEVFRPGVILLDIGMPQLNGFDAARRIRAQEWGRDIVLIALTGWDQDEDRRQAKEVGFNEHLVKPVDPVALQQLLDRLPVRD